MLVSRLMPGIQAPGALPGHSGSSGSEAPWGVLSLMPPGTSFPVAAAPSSALASSCLLPPQHLDVQWSGRDQRKLCFGCLRCLPVPGILPNPVAVSISCGLVSHCLPLNLLHSGYGLVSGLQSHLGLALGLPSPCSRFCHHLSFLFHHSLLP